MDTLLDLARRKHKRIDFVSSLTTSAPAYSTGDVIGSVMTISGSATQEGLGEADLSSILQSLVVLDPTGQSAALDIFFFNAPLTGTYTDNIAFSPSSADMKNCIGTVSVATGDYITAGSQSVAAGKNQANLGHVIKQSPPTVKQKNTIYAIAVSRGTPTYTNNLQIRFQFSNGL